MNEVKFPTRYYIHQEEMYAGIRRANTGTVISYLHDSVLIEVEDPETIAKREKTKEVLSELGT